MEFFNIILSKSFIMILHKLLIFLIILLKPVQLISINDHQTALTATFSEIDLGIIPNLTILFQNSYIHWKALFDTNPTVPVLGESDGRISRNVHLKLMVEILERSLCGAFYSRHYNICNIFHRFSFKNIFYKFILKRFPPHFSILNQN